MRKTVTIKKVTAETHVEAVVNATLTDDFDVDDVEEVWTPRERELIEVAEHRGVDWRRHLEHHQWDWAAKVDRANSQMFHADASTVFEFWSIECDGASQGIIAFSYDPRIKSKVSDEPILYVNYIQVAPWNQSGFLAELGLYAEYRYVGTQLMLHAAQVSIELGLSGVGLDSLKGALGFYTEHCGMTVINVPPPGIIPVSPTSGIRRRPSEDSKPDYGFPLHVEDNDENDETADDGLPYLEMSAEVRARFLGKHGQEHGNEGSYPTT
jgi:hypothetical protein